MEDGPVTDEKEFDMKLVAGRIAELVDQYGLSFNGTDLVNTDDDMADRCFQAGVDLIESAGVYCTSNGRRLTWTREEITNAIRFAPDSMTIGSGRDAHSDRHRFPEDPQPPTILGGPIGNPVPEELFVPIMQSYIQEPILDAIMNPTLESVYGRAPRTSSPWEVLGAWHELELTMVAARRAGREGIAIGCVASASTDIAELSASSYGGFRQTDYHHIAMISELKTDYKLLNKLTHLIRTDSIIHSFYNPIYGGLAGGAEGMAILGVAGMIALQMTYMTSSHSTSPTHPFYNGCNTTPEILWGTSLFTQALARNTPFITVVATTPVGGPCTKTLLYEVASMSLVATTSGATRIMGPRSGAGVIPGFCSGLESRFYAEVAHAASPMTRSDANEIVKQLVPKYVDVLPEPPTGKRFDEAYDLNTLQPTPEWDTLYQETKQELTQLGLPLA
jgi:methylamine--corrinoid protein Co-methyltransferase